MSLVTHLIWIRRDMRLHDHRALAEALSQPGTVQPVFVFDTSILARFSNPHDRRLSFIAETLSVLHGELKQRGGGMLVLCGEAERVMPSLCAALKPERLIAARDVEPLTRARDRAVYQALADTCEMVSVEDHLVLFPERVKKENGAPYTVFTPFSKRWHTVLKQEDYQESQVVDAGRYAPFSRVTSVAKEAGLQVLDAGDPAGMLAAIGYQRVSLGEWDVRKGHAALGNFVTTHLKQYAERRNLPAVPGTSKLSVYLRFGQVSVRECLRAAFGLPGAEKWISELIWRDFYAAILYRFPEVVDQEFLPKYRGTLNWNRSQEQFARWQQGQTGYPLVDAAMRQLLQTGWMHNRTRMVTASFLMKDLQIDWRWGEKHFAQYLMDYDLASNNGGWQWCASTGTDAQPWFRIFNPVTQSETYDPEGSYIRQFVPELASLSDKAIHAPWKKGGIKGYPAPLVDHAEAREKTLAMFKAAG